MRSLCRRDSWIPLFACVALVARLCGVCSAADPDNGSTANSAATGDPRSVSFQIRDAAQSSELRLALVIGNGSYSTTPLANPANDARAIAIKLRELGFEVLEKENATRDDMERMSREFGERLKLGGVGVFYYAGHGVQTDGVNYLLPVDSDIQDETELRSRAYDVTEMLSKMDAAKNRLNIIILDACRNNPLAPAPRSLLHGGLAAMQQGSGTIVAFATQPGATAADGPVGGNSLYTEQLLLALSQPGLRVEDVFKEVRIEVFRRSGGKQMPWENSSLMGEFYFNRGGLAVPPETPARMPVQPVNFPRVQQPAALQATPLLVPRTLLDTYQLTSNLPMPAPRALAMFSADGTRLALVTQDRQLRVWELATGNLLLSHDGFDEPQASVDGGYIAGIADDHSVNTLDLNATPLLVRNFHALDARQAIIAVKVRRLLVVNRTGTIALYDIDSGRALAASSGKILGDPHVRFAPAGARALTWGGPQSDPMLLDLQSGKRVTRISDHDKSVAEVHFSGDGRLLLVSFDGGYASIYRAGDGAAVSKLALGGVKATLLRGEFLRNGAQLLGYTTLSDPKTGILHRVAIWDTSNGKELGTISDGPAVSELRSSPDSQQIYFSTADHTINVFEVNTERSRKVLTDATLVGLSPDGQRLLAREGDSLRLYEAHSFTPVARMPGQTGAFVQADANGLFATTASDGKVSLWEFEHGDPVAQLTGHIDEVEDVLLSPGGKQLVSFGKGRTAKLWGLPEVHDLDKLKRDEFESSSDYTRRVSGWTSNYTALVSLGEYNADAETFTVHIGDVTLALPTPRDEARRFSGQREGILIGKLKVFNADQLELSDVKLSRLP